MIDIDIVGQLIPNPVTMLVQLCSTLVLFLVAKKFLWNYVQNFLEARANEMQSELDASVAAKNEAEADRAKAHEELSEASEKSQEIINAAVKEAKSEKDTILAQAAKEAAAERKRAHEQIEAERQAMYDSVKDEIVNVAMDAAGKLIGTSDSLDLDQKAIAEFVKEASAHEE